MTQAQAIDLQEKWTQQDPPPLCEHPIQELAHLTQSDDGYTVGIYYCRTCGEALVHTYRVPAFSTSPPSPSLTPAIMPLPTWSPRRYLMPILRLCAQFWKG